MMQLTKGNFAFTQPVNVDNLNPVLSTSSSMNQETSDGMNNDEEDNHSMLKSSNYSTFDVEQCQNLLNNEVMWNKDNQNAS